MVCLGSRKKIITLLENKTANFSTFFGTNTELLSTSKLLQLF